MTLFDDLREEQRALRADVAELRHELRAMEGRLSEKFSVALSTALSASTSELGRAIATVDKRIDQKHADLVTWSFIFWVGAVAAIAMLAGVLGK